MVRAKPPSTLRVDADRVGTMQINSRAAQKSGPKEGRGRKEAMHSRNMHSTPIPEQTNCAELVPPWLPGSLKVEFTRTGSPRPGFFVVGGSPEFNLSVLIGLHQDLPNGAIEGLRGGRFDSLQ